MRHCYVTGITSQLSKFEDTVEIRNPERHVRKALHCGSKQQWRSPDEITLVYYCLFAPHIYSFVLHAHPFRGESHNQCNTTGEVATIHRRICSHRQQYTGVSVRCITRVSSL